MLRISLRTTERSLFNWHHKLWNEKKNLINELENAKRGNSKLQSGLKEEVSSLKDQLENVAVFLKNHVENDLKKARVINNKIKNKFHSKIYLIKLMF